MENNGINVLRPRIQTQLDLSDTTDQLQLLFHNVPMFPITGNGLRGKACSRFATVLII